MVITEQAPRKVEFLDELPKTATGKIQRYKLRKGPGDDKTMTDSSAEDLQFNYIEHLQLEKLLTAQKFVSPHPEESVFVIMHQSYELWFRQVIHDLERIIAMLESDAVAQATWLIQRLGRIFQALDTQLGILEMMSAADFSRVPVADILRAVH